MRSTRITLSALALVATASLTACGGGGGGAPSDASEKDFCGAATSLFSDLFSTDGKMPSDEEMAKKINEWGKEMGEVGTPKGISDDARKGFEVIVEKAQDVSVDDIKADNPTDFEGDLSDAEKDQADSFGEYVTKTCADSMPKMPEMPEIPTPSS